MGLNAEGVLDPQTAPTIVICLHRGFKTLDTVVAWLVYECVQFLPRAALRVLSPLELRERPLVHSPIISAATLPTKGRLIT